MSVNYEREFLKLKNEFIQDVLDKADYYFLNRNNVKKQLESLDGNDIAKIYSYIILCESLYGSVSRYIERENNIELEEKDKKKIEQYIKNLKELFHKTI